MYPFISAGTGCTTRMRRKHFHVKRAAAPPRPWQVYSKGLDEIKSRRSDEQGICPKTASTAKAPDVPMADGLL